jgi:hypothetical protein
MYARSLVRALRRAGTRIAPGQPPGIIGRTPRYPVAVCVDLPGFPVSWHRRQRPNIGSAVAVRRVERASDSAAAQRGVEIDIPLRSGLVRTHIEYRSAQAGG